MTEALPLLTNSTLPSTSSSTSLSSTKSPPSFGRTSTTKLLPQRIDGPGKPAVTGLKHAHATLDARHYKTSDFASRFLSIVVTLRVPVWQKIGMTSLVLKIFKVSGSLTNAVYFVSCPSEPTVPTLLLRIYGPSSGNLISRSKELHTLHVLSSRYNIGPRIYGTFDNGRIEEYFDSAPLTPADLRDPAVSRCIGARMAELHLVDLDTIEGPTMARSATGRDIGVKKNVQEWLFAAKDVLNLPCVSAYDRNALDLDRFQAEWTRYMGWIRKVEQVEGMSTRVFAHNDTQYGNLLRFNGKLEEGMPAHRQFIVVDFEYASVNPLAFDIANHFHEWTANYHSDVPHILDPARYPTLAERRNFYAGYLQHAVRPLSDLAVAVGGSSSPDSEEDLATLERQVRVWSAASHGMWAIWGIVQARDDLARGETQPEFDYIGYAQCRMQSFRRELEVLGV